MQKRKGKWVERSSSEGEEGKDNMGFQSEGKYLSTWLEALENENKKENENEKASDSEEEEDDNETKIKNGVPVTEL